MINSYAKVNFSLKIIKKLDNGYHEIDSIFHKVSLADKIFFEDKNKGIEIRSSGEFRKIPTNSNNTCFKAADEMRKIAKGKVGIKITIEKNIPQKAGLGGGSSNAAEVLKYLNKHWNINLDQEELMKIGAKIGADVPFFIKEDVCLKVGGIGEITENHKSEHSGKTILIIKPKYIEIDTKWAYEALDKSGSDNFEDAIFPYFPDLEGVKNKIKINGAIQANMTGSGSCIFGIFDDEKTAKNALLSIEGVGWSGAFQLR